jgi:uncharacterized OsmC-like protein
MASTLLQVVHYIQALRRFSMHPFVKALEKNMLSHYSGILERSQTNLTIKMKERQDPLCERYVNEPDAAAIVDFARTSSEKIAATIPLYTEISFGKHKPISIPVGVHPAVGGEGECPVPGDILCGAIAACLDSTIRIIANRVGVRLKKLEVTVRGSVDVRGTLRVDDSVPVAFQSFDIEVAMKPAGFVPGKMLDKLLRAAEYSCVVLQSLREMPAISVSRAKC